MAYEEYPNQFGFPGIGIQPIQPIQPTGVGMFDNINFDLINQFNPEPTNNYADMGWGDLDTSQKVSGIAGGFSQGLDEYQPYIGGDEWSVLASGLSGILGGMNSAIDREREAKMQEDLLAYKRSEAMRQAELDKIKVAETQLQIMERERSLQDRENKINFLAGKGVDRELLGSMPQQELDKRITELEREDEEEASFQGAIGRVAATIGNTNNPGVQRLFEDARELFKTDPESAIKLVHDIPGIVGRNAEQMQKNQENRTRDAASLQIYMNLIGAGKTIAEAQADGTIGEYYSKFQTDPRFAPMDSAERHRTLVSLTSSKTPANDEALLQGARSKLIGVVSGSDVDSELIKASIDRIGAANSPQELLDAWDGIAAGYRDTIAANADIDNVRGEDNRKRIQRKFDEYKALESEFNQWYGNEFRKYRDSQRTPENNPLGADGTEKPDNQKEKEKKNIARQGLSMAMKDFIESGTPLFDNFDKIMPTLVERAVEDAWKSFDTVEEFKSYYFKVISELNRNRAGRWSELTGEENPYRPGGIIPRRDPEYIDSIIQGFGAIF